LEVGLLWVSHRIAAVPEIVVVFGLHQEEPPIRVTALTT
jgi:hypothetical protein